MKIRVNPKKVVKERFSGRIISAPLINQDGVPELGFIPNLSDVNNVLSGIQHRVGCEMPERQSHTIDKFKHYVRSNFGFFGTINYNNKFDFESWLEATSYNGARKKQLREALEEGPRIPNNVCESFIKNEAYDEIKAPRTINSYPDYVKAKLGPFIKSIEKQFFSRPFFVKGLTSHERDIILRARFGGKSVGFTDFSSMEAHHFGDFAELFVELVDHMRDGHFSDEFVIFKELVLGNNQLVFRGSGVRAEIPQRLMSGALWTSLQNSFINLVILKYLRHRADKTASFSDLDTLCEGDDGIFLSFHVRKRIVKNLGLKLKINFASDFTKASFCGRVLSTRCCLTDPIKFLRKFNFLPAKYMHVSRSKELSLIKARCLSYLCEYSGTPILTPFCLRVLSQLKHIDSRYGIRELNDGYHLFQPDFEVNEVTDDERAITYQMYGIEPALQYDIEQALSHYDVMGGCSVFIPHPCNSFFVNEIR
nr:hypothetical protein [Leuven Tombus-like virus 6]